MSGSKIGGQKAAATNKAKYGPDFYAKIGAKGGRNGNTGGFASNRELARTAGAIGGKRSKRSKSPLPHCSRGHTLAPADVITDSATGTKLCRKCYNAAQRRLEAAQLEAMHFDGYDAKSVEVA